jgi:4-amino-4-deoxy-L-arabinose transferase-like glycosyltransferase
MCWAGTVYCLWRAIEGADQTPQAAGSKSEPGTAWLYAAGIGLGLGMLIKPVLIAIPACMLLAAWRNKDIRRRILRRHALGALALAILLQFPVLLWNAQHNWVMFLHIKGQAGLQATATPTPAFAWLTRPLIYVGTQAGGFGGVMFVLLIIALIIAVRQVRQAALATPATITPDQRRSAMAFSFLFFLTVPLFAFYFLLSFFTNVEPNWPVAGYFTGMLLLAGVAAGFCADRKHKDHRAWKWWIIGTALWGLAAGGLIQNMQIFYPTALAHLAKLQGTAAYEKSWWHPRHWDLSIRLREPEPRAQDVETEIKAMAAAGHTPTVVATRYNIASSLNFYLPGRPFVYCIGPWVGARQSQYDIWPGLNEKDGTGQLVHAGEDVLLVGDLSAEDELMIRHAFAHVDDAKMLPVMYLGINLRSIRIQRCFGFKGLPDTSSGRTY